MQHSSAPAKHTAVHPSVTLISIFWIFLRLGSTSFGGPIAHLGYLRHEFVERRKWLDDEAENGSMMRPMLTLSRFVSSHRVRRAARSGSHWAPRGPALQEDSPPGSVLPCPRP